MENVSIIGLDLAKNVFQAHRARSDGSVAFRTKISRNRGKSPGEQRIDALGLVRRIDSNWR